jgi:hypothetical protein
LPSTQRWCGQEATDYGGELLREFFDCAMNHAGSFGVAFQQNLVELLLADLLARSLAQRIFASLTAVRANHREWPEMRAC